MRSATKDKLSILKSYGFVRMFNAVKLVSSYYWSRITKSGKVWGSPMAASIEPTTSCNLRCPECPSGLRQFSRATGNIKSDQGKIMIDKLAKTVGYINFYFQGEPLISPHFYDLVAHARRKKIYTSTSTNAHFLNAENCQKILDSGLNRLIISIDGTTQKTYEQYRKEGSLEKVIDGAKRMVKLRDEQKAPLFIIFQFLVVKPNEHQTNDVLELAKEIGIDEVRFKTAQLYDYKNGHELMPEQDKYSRYRLRKDGTYKVKGIQGNHCWRMWSSSVITWDGDMVPCCFDKDAVHKMGNLVKRELKEIWHAPAYQNFRKQVLKDRDAIEICRNCSEGTKVWS